MGPEGEEPQWLTLRQAAHRVRRHVKTVKRWKRQGMQTRKLDGVNYVHVDALLSWWRARMLADPTRARR